MDIAEATFFALNSSANGTSAPRLPPHSRCAAAFIILVVTVIILVTIVGNVLVVVAVFTSRALRAPQNLFLVSLASADILVATLVIPFSLANEVMGYWYFGSTWCALYLALDVLFCTSSIVHLCAISLDRYWSVTSAVSYNLKRTPRRVKTMIAAVWLISAVISFPPLLMTKHDELECLLNNDTWYILASCAVSFFAPGLIMVSVYCKIYRVAKQRAATVFVAKASMARQPSLSETGFVRKGRSEATSPSVCGSKEQNQGELDAIDLEESCVSNARSAKCGQVEVACVCARAKLDGRASEVYDDDPVNSIRQSSLSKAKLAQMREKRFTFVLAVVMGVFVLCWFPFFFTYSLHAVCRESCTIPDTLFNLFFWIGYCNSSVNPIIYTIFNRDFRRAFKKIMCHNPVRS